MTRRRIPDSHAAAHPNVVPLIDVMLCIIVFYMLAAKIGVASGADESIKLVVTRLGRELTDERIGGATNTLVVNVRERLGQPFVTAAVEAIGGGSGEAQEVAVEDRRAGTRPLRDVLRALVVGKDGVAGTADDNPTLKVIVRGDREMTYKTFMPVMLSITDAGVTNVFHNTAKPGAGE